MRMALDGDRDSVERTVVDHIVDDFKPETFLMIEFHWPDGPVRIRYAWTDDGGPLGDHIDQLAMAAGYDAADYLHVATRHEETIPRGQVEIKAYPLRPVLVDVQSGVRSPEARREDVRHVVQKIGEVSGRTLPTLTPRWLGFGPGLNGRKGA